MTDTPSSPPSRVSTFDVAWDRGVATVSFDLAQPKNSFRTADVERLGAVLEEVVANEARCVVLRGARDVFSAGWDVTSMRPGKDDPAALIRDIVAPFCLKLRSLPAPTVSAIRGVALGFGLGLALSCDICLAEDDARVGSPFRNIGMVPDTGTHHYFLTRLGYAKAAELIFTGRLIDGAEATAIGLVDGSAPAGAVAAAAHKLALSIADGPTAAFRLSKEILLGGGSLGDVMAHEGHQLARAFQTADLKEGIRAFQERRAPVFTGR
jgi:enoyl-CoA hydratase/carnithine racemase